MGCGTALPTLAIFQQHLTQTQESQPPPPNLSQTQESQPNPPTLSLTFADYNPTVLRLVTLPNILLSWALTTKTSTPDPSTPTLGDLEITPELISEFLTSLSTFNISINFISGAWSPEFIQIFHNISTNTTSPSPTTSHNPTKSTETPQPLLILAAETIYSPFALHSFTKCLMSILKGERRSKGKALVGAKKVYFGVGGSMEDFLEGVRGVGGGWRVVREEVEGVRRGVVEVWGED